MRRTQRGIGRSLRAGERALADKFGRPRQHNFTGPWRYGCVTHFAKAGLALTVDRRTRGEHAVGAAGACGSTGQKLPGQMLTKLIGYSIVDFIIRLFDT